MTAGGSDSASEDLRAALQRDDEADRNDGATADQQSYLCARIGSRLYAIATEAVAEVTEPRAITAIPHTPEYIPGVFTRRGRAIPVFDVARFVGDPQDAVERYVIVAAGKLLAGVPVAKIEGIQGFVSTRLEPALPDMQRLGPFISGHFLVEGTPLLVLDAQRLLESGRPRNPRL